ncbi:MAG TPA: S-adenosylmethionine:tRNA ribosyltransferase-isomerase [Bacteroidales bacterium]|nr:S-adenosylmethionine:tRNA ribosyltransferase-isomerase [Bacteroidales bacterium]
MQKQIPIAEYTYDLPDERIAKYPLSHRDLSKLLVYDKGNILSEKFGSISQYLPENSLLVFNNTKVIKARMMFQKATGAAIEIFCLEPENPSDYQQAFNQTRRCSWKCLVGNLKKWKSGEITAIVNINNKPVTIKALLLQNMQQWQIVQFNWDAENITFGQLLENAGQIPIPPYLNRESENIDLLRYQTIYSQHEGSVAAPTAGLHFTDDVFKALSSKGVEQCAVTLHVGAGTFMPVKTDDALQHDMHAERFYIPLQNIEKLLKNIGNITAVGTTSMRALESLYQIGVALILKKNNPFLVSQWQYRQVNEQITALQALEAIINYCKEKNLKGIEAETRIMIVPGYKFRMVNRLITNFHQPQSTLLLLVAAFIGPDWRKIYDYALANNYRFLSYGDSSLLIP